MAISTYTVPAGRVVHSTKVDFVKRIIQNPINVVQYDKSLPIIEVELFNNGYSYVLPSNADMNIRFGKKDHTFVIKPVLGCDADRKKVYFEFDEQMSYFHGQYDPILELKIGGVIAGSQSIRFNIDRNPVQITDVESHSEYPDLEEINNKFDEVDARLTALEYITEAFYSITFTGSAVEGTRGGRAASCVGSTLEETIAKFMAEPFFARIQKVDLPAYKADGTPIYDTDGTTQLVNKMVFFPNAYFKETIGENTVTWAISPTPRDGFEPIWKNSDGTIPEGAYFACYNNTKDTNDISTTINYVGSFTGKAPVVNYTRVNYISKACYVKQGDEYVKLNATAPLNMYSYLAILESIVLGTRNHQSVYNAISGDGYVAPTAQSSADKTFSVGAVASRTIAVGDQVTLYYSAGYCWCTRTITAADNGTYTYSGDAVPNITYVSYRCGHKAGLTDSIQSLFGEETALPSGKRSFKMFGIEDPYGNVWEITGNAAIHGSASPYTQLYTHEYDDYDYTNPSSEISAMQGTGLNIPQSNGYAKTIRFAGSTMITTEIGASSSTYYSDFFYQAVTSNDRAPLILGGDFVSGTAAGSFYLSCNLGWLFSCWYCSARSFLLKQK